MIFEFQWKDKKVIGIWEKGLIYSLKQLQHFFGGAIGVFTTQSLLHALGISSRGTNSLAINWVIKVLHCDC